MITLLTCLPLAGALLIALLPARLPFAARLAGFAASLSALAVAAVMWLRFDPHAGGMQFVEQHDWIAVLKAQYHVGVDGLGLLMVGLAALVVPFALVATRRIRENVKGLVALLLTLQAGLFGAFTALNFFHWFIFWELSLVPAYFLIKLWGGARRVEAATQFFLYTFVGSIAMLIAFAALLPATGTFNFIELAQQGPRLEALLGSYYVERLGWPVASETVALVIFAGVLLGLAVKVPLMPFHTWLPDAYAEAPIGVTMVLTGVMSKMGVYGFLRVLLPIFPAQLRAAGTLLLALAVITIVASALAALAQHDLKRLFAYSSINHLGYCLLGIFAAATLRSPDARLWNEPAAALNGVLLQMFNHGITAAALFFCVGLIEERTGRRGVDEFGGLRQVAPVFCGLMGIMVFASLGLPGLNGFVGEFLIFKGVFALTPWAAVLALPGLLVTAVFLLTLLQRVFHGPLDPRSQSFADLSVGERMLLVPSLALMFLLGVWPQAVLGLVNGSVLELLERLRLGT